jgi:MtaA/CmuA family methyltransferase
MNAYQRVMLALEGLEPDRKPNACILMAFAAKYIRASYKQYVTDYKTLSRAVLKCAEDFDIDILSVISDPVREASGFGAPICFPENGVPYVQGVYIQDLKDISKLKIAVPESAARMNDRIMAVDLLKREGGADYPVMGWVEGALAEACDLRGMNNIMMDLVDEHEAIGELLEICTEQAILFARSQINAGADIIGIGDAAASLVGPALYEEFVLPFEQRIVRAIHEEGARARLHICGNIQSILKQVTLTGADIIDVDWKVDFKEAVQQFGDSIAACGNFDPVSVLLQGTPEKVENSVRNCLAVSRSNTFIMAGCEVPGQTPLENLKAVSAALARA